MPDSAYLWTAMHVADEKGAPYEHQLLTLRSPEHLRLHPFGKMPVMQHGGVYLYETAAIATYLDRTFPGPHLLPPTALGEAHVVRWMSIVNGYVFPIMNRFFKERVVRPSWGIVPDHEFVANARDPLLRQMHVIEEALTDHLWLAGDALTLSESFLLPHLLFFSVTPEGAALLEKAPHTAAWLARLQERPSFTRSPMATAFAAFKQLVKPAPLVWSV